MSAHKPALTIEIGHGGDDAQADGAPPAPEVGGAVACPNCGCQFDPATGAIEGGDYEQGQPAPAEAAPDESDEQ